MNRYGIIAIAVLFAALACISQTTIYGPGSTDPNAVMRYDPNFISRYDPNIQSHYDPNIVWKTDPNYTSPHDPNAASKYLTAGRVWKSVV